MEEMRAKGERSVLNFWKNLHNSLIASFALTYPGKTMFQFLTFKVAQTRGFLYYFLQLRIVFHEELLKTRN